MLARTLIAVAIALTLIALPPPTQAQEPPGLYSLELSAEVLDADPRSPADPLSVRAGSEIRFLIKHSVPSPLQANVEYIFETPPGTLFVDAEAIDGTRISIELAPGVPRAAAPEDRGDVRVVGKLRATTGSIEVTVRVNDVYQGQVSGFANFRDTGEGVNGPTSPGALTLQYDHGDGVPGALEALSFVDLNGNGVFEMDDVPRTCPVYVYSDLTVVRIPDDVSSPVDARLPLVAVSSTAAREPARIALFPGRYSVLYGGCDTPRTPSGAVQSAFELIDRPAVTRVLSDSGAASYEVQTFDITSTQITEIVRAAQPIGPLAPPTDLRFNGARILTWTDLADREDGYRIEVSGTVITQLSALANSEQFILPSSLYVCGFNDIIVSVSATLGAAAGYPVTARYSVISDCAILPPLLPPNTGTGPASTARLTPIALAAVFGTLLAATGLAIRNGATSLP